MVMIIISNLLQVLALRCLWGKQLPAGQRLCMTRESRKESMLRLTWWLSTSRWGCCEARLLEEGLDGRGVGGGALMVGCPVVLL